MADPIDRPRRSYAGPEGSERAMFQAALSQSSLHRFWSIQRRIARDGSPGTRNASDPLRLVDRRSPYPATRHRSEEHTSELQSLMRISYAVFCLKKKKK